MRQALVIIILLMLSSPAHAEGKWLTWDDTNTKLHVPLTILMFADYRQTLYNEKTYYRYGGFNNNEYHSEANKFLGKYPSRKKIHKYFASAFVTCTIIPFILPPELSYIFQGGVIVIEADVVNGNYYIGAKYFL